MRSINPMGRSYESIIYYINPESTAPAVPVAVSSPTIPKNGLAAGAEKAIPVTSALSTETEVAHYARKRPKDHTDAKKMVLSVNHSREPRVFRSPHVSTFSADSQMRAELPDAPDIAISQRAPFPPLLASTMLASLSIQGRPSWGRLIWTGELQKNEFVSFSWGGSSRGVLNGRLPGFPVKITILPGEVVDGGIAILTNELNRAGINEPSHARNGWDMVFYKWVQKPIPELRVVESPGPLNNWSRIVLQNTDRNLSVVVVDWQEAKTTKPGD